jgi:hypothetical protein
MSITYEQIKQVSDGIVTTDIKGKQYAGVNGRINAFRRLYPQGFISTEIVNLADGMVVMKATCGYYENGQAVVLGTGLAYEREGSSNINKTSFIENCETSAVGRALGMAGLGISTAVASGEEMENAIQQQEEQKNEADPKRRVELVDEINNMLRDFNSDEKRTIFSMARQDAGIEPKEDGTPKTSGIMKVSELEKMKACVADVIGRMK